MTESPAVPIPDDKDWTWVLRESCPECGFDPAVVAFTDIGPGAQRSARAMAQALARPDAAARPSPPVWSVLEYGCHLRDVCRIFAERTRLMLTEDDPQFANWNQDETALAQRYWEQDPAVVAKQLIAAADAAADVFAAVAGEQWNRSGRRSNGSVFTVGTLGVYFLHDLVHHVHDVSG